MIEDTYGEHAVKLAAGDMVLYAPGRAGHAAPGWRRFSGSKAWCAQPNGVGYC
ncbi:MAG: hypothetical protein ACU83P_03835 [Gammaproteobacteria bacterium]